MNAPTYAAHEHRTGLALAIVLSLGIVWGTAYTLPKIAMAGGVPPLGLTFWPAIGSGIILLTICLLRRRPLSLSRQHFRYCLAIAFFNTLLPTPLLMVVIHHLPIGLMSVILALHPLLTYAFAYAIRAERFSMWRFIGVLCGLAGALMVLLPKTSLPSPDLLVWVLTGLLVPCLYAGSNLYMGLARPPGADSLVLGAGSQLFAAVLLVPLAVFTDSFYLPWSPFGAQDAALLTYVGVICFAALGMFEIARLAGPVMVSQVTNVMMPASIVAGIVFFNEQPSLWLWGASAAVLVGLAMVTGLPAKAPVAPPRGSE